MVKTIVVRTLEVGYCTVDESVIQQGSDGQSRRVSGRSCPDELDGIVGDHVRSPPPGCRCWYEVKIAANPSYYSVPPFEVRLG